MRYAVVLERSETGFSAYAPDLPGLGVTGASIEEVRELISRGVAIYVEELRARGEAIPQPSAVAEYAENEIVAQESPEHETLRRSVEQGAIRIPKKYGLLVGPASAVYRERGFE